MEIKPASAVAIVGLGYVGLPLALKSQAAGYKTVGFDLSESKIEALMEVFRSGSDASLTEYFNDGGAITSNENDMRNQDVYIICVPTPLDDGAPDYRAVIGAANSIGRQMRADSLVVLESTVGIGATRDIVLPILRKSAIERGLDDYLELVGFSPERVDPGNEKFDIATTPKVVSGVCTKSLLATKAFYERIVTSVVLAGSTEEAEASKLLENAFRLVNITFINEFATSCHYLGLDPSAVIELAATKPFGFMRFTPSVGAGGHCIPVDPAYLTSSSRSAGYEFKILELSLSTNAKRPIELGAILRKLKDDGNLERIVLLGLSYKANIADFRESRQLDLLKFLVNQGEKVGVVEPLLDSKNFDLLNGAENISQIGSLDPSRDLVVITQAHADFKASSNQLLALGRVRKIVDLTGQFAGPEFIHL